jgi:hypothetical protein
MFVETVLPSQLVSRRSGSGRSLGVKPTNEDMTGFLAVSFCVNRVRGLRGKLFSGRSLDDPIPPSILAESGRAGLDSEQATDVPALHCLTGGHHGLQRRRRDCSAERCSQTARVLPQLRFES